MAGSKTKRCGCTEVVEGRRRQLGQQCPKPRASDRLYALGHWP